MVKLQSVLKVYKFNTNYTIKFYKCPGEELLPSVHQKMFLEI